MADLTKDTLLDAALIHVTFDGWSTAAFEAAISETGCEPSLAKMWYPRGALDMAIAFHVRGDTQMIDRLKNDNLLAMRYRDRIAAGVRYRLEAIADHKEAVRRGSSLFSLPQNAAHGARLVWGTADAIWTTLGDTSVDYNWYTKRATLSGVYGATVLFWLGDTSDNHAATWEFLDRRIDDVMQIEKIKAQVNANPVASKLLLGPNWLLSMIRPPTAMADPDLPGRWNMPPKG